MQHSKEIQVFELKEYLPRENTIWSCDYKFQSLTSGSIKLYATKCPIRAQQDFIEEVGWVSRQKIKNVPCICVHISHPSTGCHIRYTDILYIKNDGITPHNGFSDLQ